MKKFVWITWGIVSVAIGAYYGHTFLFKEDKTNLLIGDTTYGHFQIEMSCSTCHTEAFGGKEVLQDACMNCHAEELDAVNDSHPKPKFTNPRNADRVAILDARYCITCHTEHQRESTLAMGVTLPDDFCFHCHQDIAEERPTHKDLGYDTCATAGCHNFHDNLALYENFLVEHAAEDWLFEVAAVAVLGKKVTEETEQSKALTLEQIDAPPQYALPEAISQWRDSVHSEAGVNCSGCHTDDSYANETENSSLMAAQVAELWIAKPGLQQCKNCHQQQANRFVEGKHGMRLSPKLSNVLEPMSPSLSQDLPFHTDSLNKTQNCGGCHQSHDFNIKVAAAEACLSCHNDEHSLAYESSPHAQLWQKEIQGELPAGMGVSCSTCHMPRETHIESGNKIVRVQHNQNLNLRPNEKMIRGVCMNCHGLPFVIDALADAELIQSNFNGRPQVHIPSIDMAVQRRETVDQKVSE